MTAAIARPPGRRGRREDVDGSSFLAYGYGSSAPLISFLCPLGLGVLQAGVQRGQDDTRSGQERQDASIAGRQKLKLRIGK